MFAVAIAPFFMVTSYGHYNLVRIASETKQFSDYIDDLNPITHVSLHINLSAKSAYNYLTTGEKKERENFQKTVRHTKITMLRFTKFSFIDHYENETLTFSVDFAKLGSEDFIIGAETFV